MNTIGLVKPCNVDAHVVYVDSMLGWLSRWLRMIGILAIYRGDFNDEELARVNGLVVTRDRGLYSRRPGDTLLLLTDNHVHWLATILTVLNAKPMIGDNSRCPICGGELTKVDSSEALGKVPLNVIRRNRTLLKCKSCGRYYWVGSHHRGIERTLRLTEEVMRELSVVRINSECAIQLTTQP